MLLLSFANDYLWADVFVFPAEWTQDVDGSSTHRRGMWGRLDSIPPSSSSTCWMMGAIGISVNEHVTLFGRIFDGYLTKATWDSTGPYVLDGWRAQKCRTLTIIARCRGDARIRLGAFREYDRRWIRRVVKIHVSTDVAPQPRKLLDDGGTWNYRYELHKANYTYYLRRQQSRWKKSLQAS